MGVGNWSLPLFCSRCNPRSQAPQSGERSEERKRDRKFWLLSPGPTEHALVPLKRCSGSASLSRVISCSPSYHGPLANTNTQALAAWAWPWPAVACPRLPPPPLLIQITGTWAQPSNWTYYFPDSPVTGSGHTTPFGPRPEQKPCAQLLGCASQGSGPLLSSPKPEAVGGGAVLASYLP